MSDEQDPPQEPKEVKVLTPEDWEQVNELIAKSLDRRGLPWKLEGGVLRVIRDSGAISVPLDELAEIMRQSEPADRKRMLNHWLRIMLAREDGVDIQDFSQVRDLIRIRLFPEDIDTGGQELAEMLVMPGIRAVIALDLPEAVVAMRRDQVAHWGLEDRDLFGMGLHHVVHDNTVTAETLDGPEGAIVHVHTGPSHFVASRALALEQWVDNPNGALVSVPNRHTLLFHSIEDARALNMIPALAMLGQPAFVEGPGSISREVYWWLPGRFAKIELVEDPTSGALALRPPASFKEMMARIGVSLDDVGAPPDDA